MYSNNRFWLYLYGQLSIYNLISIFPSQFPTIPRKISAYLRTYSYRAQIREKQELFYNILNINDLCLNGISSHCKKHHFGLQNGLFRRLKSTISHPKIGYFAPRNGQYRKAKCIFSDYDMGYIERRYIAKRAS